MKDVKYYVAGFSAIALFVYLLHVGEKEMAKELFTYLMFILAFVFGLQSPTPAVQSKENTLEMEEMRTE